MREKLRQTGSEMNISFPVYAQCLLVTVLYCALALPFVLLFLLLHCCSRAGMQGVIRFFILWYGKAVIYIGCFPYLRIQFRDLSGEPAEGGIYIFNHRSSSDPFLVAATTFRPPAQVVNRWPMRLPFFGVFARLGGYLDITSMTYEEARSRTAELIARNVPVMVFPEGTRSGNRSMNQFHSTFFRIAKELDCKLVPMVITGNENSPGRDFRMHPGRIRICRLPRVDQRIVRDTPPYQLKNLVRSMIYEQSLKMDAE